MDPMAHVQTGHSNVSFVDPSNGEVWCPMSLPTGSWKWVCLKIRLTNYSRLPLGKPTPKTSRSNGPEKCSGTARINSKGVVETMGIWD